MRASAKNLPAFSERLMRAQHRWAAIPAAKSLQIADLIGVCPGLAGSLMCRAHQA
jgi:hypothetical protein